MVRRVAVDETARELAELQRDDLADEERVIASVVFGPRVAFEPRERAFDEGAARALPDVRSFLEDDGRDAAAREVLRDVHLVLG